VWLINSLDHLHSLTEKWKKPIGRNPHDRFNTQNYWYSLIRLFNNRAMRFCVRFSNKFSLEKRFWFFSFGYYLYSETTTWWDSIAKWFHLWITSTAHLWLIESKKFLTNRWISQNLFVERSVNKRGFQFTINTYLW
jgi:hypothetical protein